VRIPPTPRFHAERAHFALRFTCEDCAMWDPDREQCAHGYPPEDHRHARYDRPDVELVFCKDFQLA